MLEDIKDSKSFYEEVGRRARASGSTELLTTYQILDEMTEQFLASQEVEIACGEGCYFCCNQLIVVTTIEWKAIEKYLFDIRDGKIRYDLNKRMQVSNKLWNQYARSLGSWEKTKNEKNALRTYEDWLGKAPCPFLNSEGKCDIYPVRPICCRTYTSGKKCESWGDSGAQQFRFEFQAWANGAIGKIIGDHSDVIPIPYFAGEIKL